MGQDPHKSKAAEDYLGLDDQALLAQCKVQIHRSSGPGGQHRNKVSTACRLHHAPTGVSAQAYDSRSQRENRVKALTAQGRATARWLGAMPIVVLLILNFIMGDQPIKQLFADSLGKLIILAIVVLNVVGFLWIRKIVSLDI